jgi:hypothetical protein
MDAMSDAIEGADVMLYGVSLRYKESANVSPGCHCSPSASLCLPLQSLLLFADIPLLCCVSPCLRCICILQCRLEANVSAVSAIQPV